MRGCRRCCAAAGPLPSPPCSARDQLLDERGQRPQQYLIYLVEKGKAPRWQPISPTLMANLLHHASQRGTQPGEQLLRYRNGKPITRRRYDGLWTRIGYELPWVENSRSPPTGYATPP